MAITTALARWFAAKRVKVRSPMATNAANAALLWKQRLLAASDDSLRGQFFALTASSKLIFNACPTKLSAESILSCAKRLALSEIEDFSISEVMGSSSDMLSSICHAITAPGDTALDAVWASVVLIVYLCCHPAGRKLLRQTNLTDVDYQTAAAFEAYGRAEITRRARLEAQQAGGKRKKVKAELRRKSEWETPENQDQSDGDVFDDLDAQERDVLATKRKRGAKGCASASSSDSLGVRVRFIAPANPRPLPSLSHLMGLCACALFRCSSGKLLSHYTLELRTRCTFSLNWRVHRWHKALKCENSSVLLSLVAHTKQAARDAACATLKKQAANEPSVMQNDIIRGISEDNAVQSAKALVPFVGRRASEVPAVLAWKWKNETFHGVTRTEQEARFTALHACRFSDALQPHPETEIAVASSHASIQFSPQNNGYEVLPCVAERLHDMLEFAARGKRQAVAASRMSATTYTDAEAPRTTEVSGVTRSFLSFRTFLDISPSQQAAAAQLADEIVSASTDGSAGSAGLLLSESRRAEERLEPTVTPCSGLAVGIALNEELKGWLASPVLKTRKNGFTKVQLGTTTQQETSRDAPSIINSEPPPLLTVCDIHMEIASGVDLPDTPDTPDVARAREASVGVGLSVCGDAAVRVPEAARTVLRHDDVEARGYLHARALLWAGISQSSFICACFCAFCASTVHARP